MRPVRDALKRFGHDDVLNRQLYADLSLYLADDILVKVDRMSMATSLETRAPFLDADVMELAFSMPGDLKIRNGERKWILKRAMRGVLPERILTRTKEGFSIPMKNWLRARAAAADADAAVAGADSRPRAVRRRPKSRASSTRTSPAARTTRTRCFR